MAVYVRLLSDYVAVVDYFAVILVFLRLCRCLYRRLIRIFLLGLSHSLYRFDIHVQGRQAGSLPPQHHWGCCGYWLIFFPIPPLASGPYHRSWAPHLCLDAWLEMSILRALNLVLPVPSKNSAAKYLCAASFSTSSLFSVDSSLARLSTSKPCYAPTRFTAAGFFPG